jgi:hypothetical protein
MNGSHEAIDYRVPWHKIEEGRHSLKEDKHKTLELEEGKTKVHYVVFIAI